MKSLLLSILAGLVLCAGPLAGAEAPAARPLDAYTAVGASFINDNRLGQMGWTKEQAEAFVRGVRAALDGQVHPIDASAQGLMEEIGRRLEALDREQHERQFGAKAFAQPGHLQKYLREISREFELEPSDSGLRYGIRTAGYGVRPGPEDTVVVSYKVCLADARTEVASLQTNRRKVRIADLLPGLAEVLQRMTTDSAAMVVLPPDLSYAEGEWPAGTERGTPLVFTVKLHEVMVTP